MFEKILNYFLSIIIRVRKSITFKNVFILIFLILAAWVIEIKITRQDKNKENNEGVSVFENQPNAKIEDSENVISNKESTVSADQESKNQANKEKEIPDKIFIKVPFTSQAPLAVWDDVHEEACEEASLIMLKYFFSEENLTKEIAEKEIRGLVDFQNKKHGDYRDTTAQETADLFSDFYGKIDNSKKLKVVYDFQKNDLKKYLAYGFPIIIPAAGRELGNPYFTAPGPLYHNLVLIGYIGDTIITNDPGTKRGESYKYDIDVIYNAIHDFPGKPEDIGQGRKAMIVVEE